MAYVTKCMVNFQKLIFSEYYPHTPKQSWHSIKILSVAEIFCVKQKSTVQQKQSAHWEYTDMFQGVCETPWEGSDMSHVFFTCYGGFNVCDMSLGFIDM